MIKSPKCLKHKTNVRKLVILSAILILTSTILNKKTPIKANAASTNLDDPIRIEYFNDPNCDVCKEKLQWFEELKDSDEDLNLTVIDVYFSGDNQNYTQAFEYTKAQGFGILSPPAAIFYKGN